MIYIEVSKNDFRDAFKRVRPDNFSYNGLGILFDHIEGLSDDTDRELDVISICCDYSEMSLKEALKNYTAESIDELRDSYLILEVDSETLILGE